MDRMKTYMPYYASSPLGGGIKTQKNHDTYKGLILIYGSLNKTVKIMSELVVVQHYVNTCISSD